MVTFRALTESDTASTTALLITSPADTPFLSASMQPMAGWTGKVTMKKLPTPQQNDDGDEITDYVSQVEFKAAGAASAIPPGDFDMFNISVGPFPKKSSVSFAVQQTYSDGTTVNWNAHSANGTEPEHPAPTLQLAAAADTSGTGAQSNASSSSDPSMSAMDMCSSSNGTSSNWPGIVGLIAGILALLISVAALLFVRGRGARSSTDA